MHEMGIAMQIIEIASASIPGDLTDVSVEKVNIKVGKLSAVIPDSLNFCFSIASQDTVFSGASLNIKEIPVTCKCKNCKNEWTVTGPDFTCNKCSSGSVDIIAGRELDIVSIELAD